MREVQTDVVVVGGGTAGCVVAARVSEDPAIRTTLLDRQRELERLDYRLQWDADFRKYLARLAKQKPVVVCGDLNVAHEEIDLANPKTNRRNAGFTDEERTNFTTLLDAGFIDTFRHFEPGPGHYTWWSQMMNCRARNIGWRVDYFVAQEKLRPALQKAWISPEVMGSDHCPVGLEVR